jgi:hypothetical protein
MVASTIKMYDRAVKGNIKVTNYPEAGHDLTENYKDPMINSWLLHYETKV